MIMIFPFLGIRKKSSWNPKHSKNTTLESFIYLVKIDVQDEHTNPKQPHSTEKGAIQELKERDDIVIKPVDKGSAVVVMDKVNYLGEANRQVTDERFYKKLDSDPTKEFSTRITQELKIMRENSHIDKNTFDYLKPDKPKVGPSIYYLKLIKSTAPGDPLFQQLGTPQKKSPNSSISTFDFMYKRYFHI
jgi:hypothetical protein